MAEKEETCKRGSDSLFVWVGEVGLGMAGQQMYIPVAGKDNEQGRGPEWTNGTKNKTIKITQFVKIEAFQN